MKLSKLTQDNKVQLTAALISAVAVLVAAISGPLMSYFFSSDTPEREGTTQVKPVIIESEPPIPLQPNNSQAGDDVLEPDRRTPSVAVKPNPTATDTAAPAEAPKIEPAQKPSAEPGQPEPVFPQQSPTVPTGWRDPVVLTVFQRKEFDLCGYQGFKAEVDSGAYGGQALKIVSMDRDIPGRDLRGYRRTVNTGKWELLWPHCRAKFNIVKLEGTVRITISYRRRDK